MGVYICQTLIEDKKQSLDIKLNHAMSVTNICISDGNCNGNMFIRRKNTYVQKLEINSKSINHYKLDNIRIEFRPCTHTLSFSIDNSHSQVFRNHRIILQKIYCPSMYLTKK